MARDTGPSFLTSPSFLQILLNVALFVPLGLVIGWRTRWPLVIAAIMGLAGSLLIELTQVTRVWWLYDCAYRFGDLQDIVTNTSGAIIGWLVGRRLVRRRTRLDPERHPGRWSTPPPASTCTGRGPRGAS